MPKGITYILIIMKTRTQWHSTTHMRTHTQLQKANRKHFETKRTVLRSLLLNHGAHWRRIGGPTEEDRRVFSSWKQGEK